MAHDGVDVHRSEPMMTTKPKMPCGPTGRTGPTGPTGVSSPGWFSRPGVLFKRLMLLIGAVYLSFVAVTNAVDLVAAVGGYHWTVLDSGNTAYIQSITKGRSRTPRRAVPQRHPRAGDPLSQSCRSVQPLLTGASRA
jgi:hypothetical protein